MWANRSDWANRTELLLIKTVVLAKEPADLVVIVMDHNKKALDSPKIELFCHDPPKQIVHILRDDGVYLFERSLPTLRPGECTLKVTKKG